MRMDNYKKFWSFSSVNTMFKCCQKIHICWHYFNKSSSELDKYHIYLCFILYFMVKTILRVSLFIPMSNYSISAMFWHNNHRGPSATYWRLCSTNSFIAKRSIVRQGTEIWKICQPFLHFCHLFFWEIHYLRPTEGWSRLCSASQVSFLSYFIAYCH